MALLAKLDPEASAVLGGMPEGGADGAVELVVKEGLEVLLPLAGLFDAEKERKRLQKQQAKLEKNLGGLKARLGNEKFVASAPAAVVDEVRGQVAEAEEQLAMVQSKLEQVRPAWLSAGESAQHPANGPGSLGIWVLPSKSPPPPPLSALLPHTCLTLCYSYPIAG